MLDLSEIKGTQVLAGEKGLNRTVSSISILDNPDTGKWLSKGEFLITTGYLFLANPEYKVNLLTEMENKFCSGLGLKTKRFFNEAPREILEECNRKGIPLLEIPYDYSLNYVVKVIYSEILNRQAVLLKKSEILHNKFREIFFRSGIFSYFVSEVASIINNPIIICDNDWQPIAWADVEGNKYPIDEYVRLMSNYSILSSFVTKKISDSVDQWNKAVLRTDKGEKDVFPCRILTIVVGGNIYGYIIVPEIMSELNKIDYIAIEHAGVIAAYEIVKQRAVEEDRKRLKRDFFNSLLAGKLKSLEAVSNLSSVHRLDCSKCYVCIVVEFENYEKFTSEDFLKEQEKLNNLQEKAIKATNETALKLNQHIITTEQGSKVVLFLQYNRDTNSESARKLSKIFARELFNAYKRINQKQYCYIGIGKLYNNILKLYLSYGEALEAIKLSKTLNERISHIDDFSIYRLFDLTEKEKVDAFMKNIYKLVENDKKNDSDLVKTLDTFFQCMANQTETAKRLYIHRNTLTYRINKIKSILGIDLDNPDECLELQIAIKILRFLSN